MHYVNFWQKMQVMAGLEKLSASSDTALATQAQEEMALVCDEIFSSVKSASGSLAPELMRLRGAHRVTGEKIAASPDVAAELLQKLATVEYVDEMLEDQIEKFSGEAQSNARSVQLLGREYAVQMMWGLFA